MEPNNWAPAHSEALREYWARGMFYSEIADAINAKFGTCYKPQRHHWPRQAHGAWHPRSAGPPGGGAATQTTANSRARAR